MVNYTVPNEVGAEFQRVITEFVREQQARISIIENHALLKDPRQVLLTPQFANTNGQNVLKATPQGALILSNLENTNTDYAAVIFNAPTTVTADGKSAHPTTYIASIKPAIDGCVSFSWKSGANDHFEHRADDGTATKPVMLMDAQGLKNALHTWFREVGGVYAPVARTASKIGREPAVA